MNKNKNILLGLLITVTMLASSCSDFLDINKDPNRITDDNITPGLIFTQAENAIGTRQAVRFVFLNNWMGYWARSGTFIVEQEETTYKVTSTFPENNWDNAYNILFDLNQAKIKAIADKDSVLTGASIILSVKLWQEMVDMFGDLPYTQAFDYIKYPQPVYDKATDIYADLIVQLDNAITYLDANAPRSTFANTDIVFARGESVTSAVAQWKKLANTIKLRIFLRQSESGFTPNAGQLAKITTDGGFLGIGESVSVNPGYTNDENKQNPFYGAYGKTPSGSAATTNNKPNNYFVKTILGNTDPRLDRFFATPIAGTDYGALGGNAADPNATIVGSEIGPGLVVSSTADQFILPAFESLFFQAEAAARGWIPGGDATAQAFYEDAVRESFRWLKVTTTPTLLSGDALADSLANDYIATYYPWTASGITLTEKVNFIAYQKYIAMGGVDPLEAWSDLRRGALVLTDDGYLSHNAQRAPGLPNLLPYPQTEITTNGGHVPSRSTTTIFTEKLFWQP